MVLGHCGWFWVVVDGFGWLWVVVDGFGSFLVLVSTSVLMVEQGGSLDL